MSAETICTVAIWSIAIDVLPPGVARHALDRHPVGQSLVTPVTTDHHHRQLAGGSSPSGPELPGSAR